MRIPSPGPGRDVETHEPDGVSVCLLGGFAAGRHRVPLVVPMSVQRLIAFLALNPRAMMRTYVAGVLWPDTGQARAEASLRSALWRARGTGENLIESTSTHLTLTQALRIDIHDVIELVHRLMDPDATCASADLDPARLTGDLLPDWSDEDWLHLERERMRQLCLHGLESQSSRLMSQGRYGEAVEAGLAAVRAEPLRESAHRLLIEIYMSEGNAAEALRQYDWYRRILYAELGLEPSADVARLVQPVWPRSPAPPVRRQSAPDRMAGAAWSRSR